jgi:hypothetical protein
MKKIEPQIKAPRVTPLEGVSTYGCAIRVVWESRTARFRHDERRFVKNEDAVSITLGFILMLSITVLVFSAIILSFYTLSQQSEKVAMRESFDILGSGLAIRITTVDTIVNMTNYYGGAVNSLEYEFSIPASIANEGFSINITNSTKQIILESDDGATSWVPFNTSSDLMQTTIYSSAQDYKFNYSNNMIRIEEQ